MGEKKNLTWFAASVHRLFFFFLTKCKWPHHANTDLIKTKSSWSASFT